jgi:hypothetical protein
MFMHVEDADGSRVCKGLIDMGNPPKKRFIKVAFVIESQMPRIELIIAKLEGGEVNYHIFANIIP